MAKSNRRKLLVVFIAAGVVSGGAAVLFHRWVELSRVLLLEHALQMRGLPRVILIIFIPTAMAALLGWVVQRFAPTALGANLARVRRGYAENESHLDWRTIISTFVMTPLSLGSGAPLGPEGPTVVVTSGLSVWVGRVFKLPRRLLRGMIPVGTAAGIAAIFRTPITGVVFALEELSGTSSRSILGGTLVAAVSAAVVQQVASQDHARILPAFAAVWTDLRELVGFGVVGICAGIVSGTVLRFGVKLRDLLRNGIPSIPLRFAIGGAAAGLMGVLNPSMLGVGYETTALFLKGGATLSSAAAAFGTKTLGFLVAASAGLLGGTFAPSLFIGASLGAVVGHLGTVALPGVPIDVGAYALVGMGAYFAGTLRAPIAAVLIVLELTNDYGLIIPLMLGVVLSNTISHALAPLTLEEDQLRREGVRDQREVRDPLARLVVRDVMSVNPIAFGPDAQIAEVIERTRDSRHNCYPVVDENRMLLGLLAGETVAGCVRQQQLDIAVATLMTQPRIVSREHETLQELLVRMAETRTERAPVLDDTGALIGFVTPSDLMRARFREHGFVEQESDH